MHMEPTESSNVESIGYDRKSQKMRVKFRKGTTYEYENVTDTDHRLMVDSKSKGKHLHSIKGHCKGCKIS